MKINLRVENSTRVITVLIIPDSDKILLTTENGEIIAKVTFSEMYNIENGIDAKKELKGLFVQISDKNDCFSTATKSAEYYVNEGCFSLNILHIDFLDKN